MTPFPRAQLRTWLAAMAEISTDLVIFQGEPDPIVGDDGAGTLLGILRVTITSSEEVFWESSYDTAPGTTGDSNTPIGTPNMQTTTTTTDYVTLTLVFESYAPATTNLAYDTLAKIRVRCFQTPNIDAARAFFVGVLGAGNLNNISNFRVDTRALSVATMDMQISHKQSDTYLGDFVASVQADGDGELTGIVVDTDPSQA